MIQLLRELHDWASKSDDLFSVAVLERLIKRVNDREITEKDLPIPKLKAEIDQITQNPDKANRLLIFFLIIVEKYESQKIREALHMEVARRRELIQRLKTEKQEAARANDAIKFLKIERDLKLLQQAPKKTRQIDPETVDLAIKASELKEKHNWSNREVANHMFGDPSQEDRIKKAIQRTGNEIPPKNKRGKSVP